MESVFSGTLIQKMTKFPHGDNFYGDPDITSIAPTFLDANAVNYVLERMY